MPQAQLGPSSREAVAKSPACSTSASHTRMGTWDQTKVPLLEFWYLYGTRRARPWEWRRPQRPLLSGSGGFRLLQTLPA